MKRRVIALSTAALLIGGGLYLKSQFLSSGDSYRPGGDVREKLRAEKPVLRGGRTVLGPAWKEKRDGNMVLEISGEPYEMGYRHGALLREEIAGGVVPVFADPVGHSKEHGRKPAIVKWLLLKYLEWRVYGPLERNTPREYLEEIKGIADGSGLDYGIVFRATFKSELGMVMTPGVINKKARDLGVAAECSDFAASGPATADGKLLVGRNTDYAGQGRWMKGQTVFLYRPKKGHAYVNVSTAGLIKCNSAMNEKGVVVGGHFMAFEGASPRGLSFTVLEHEIMRKAAGLDEAVAIVTRGPRAGTFGFLVADGMKRDAVVIDANAESAGVRKMSNHSIVITNCATTAELKNSDLTARYNMVMRDMMGRYLRLEELIAGNFGRITPGLAAGFMGDHVDFVTKTERGTGITVGAANNVTSMVFSPEEGLIWIATGSEPACNSPFVAFDFRAWLNGTEPRKPAPLPGYRWRDPSREKGLRAYMRAYAASEENPEDTAAVLEHLDEAVKADPGEPIYARMKAIIELQNGDYKNAAALLVHSLSLTQSNNEKAHSHFLAGLAFDLLGERGKALEHYRAVERLHGRYGADVLTGINGMLRGLGARYMKRAFTVKEINDIPAGFSSESGLE